MLELLFFMIFFVIMEYIAHKKGVIMANKYPIKFGDSGVRFVKSPPVIKKNPPIVASKKPLIFNEFNFSLKKIKAKIVIITGAKRQTINAGSEGPIVSMALYCARKNKETPAKLEKKIKIQLFLENLRLSITLNSFVSVFLLLFLNFRYKSINRKVAEAIIKRYNAIDKGGTNSRAISTIMNEKLHTITMNINSKYINNTSENHIFIVKVIVQ